MEVAAAAGDRDATAALDTFYAASIGSAPVRVVQSALVPASGKPRGKIVVATAAVARGETLLRERPLIAMQSVTNKLDVVVCAHCHRFLGDVDYQADVLTRTRSRLDIGNHGVVTSDATTDGADTGSATCRPAMRAAAAAGVYRPVVPVQCLAGCGELYCSAKCRSHDAARGHDVLCTGPHEEDHPIVSFKVHAVQTNDIFLFAAKVVADVVKRHEQLDCSCATAWLPYSRFVQEPWWDVVNVPEGSDDTAAEFSQKLLDVASESFELLHASLALWHEARGSPECRIAAWASFFTLDLWGRIIGMFEQNQVGVRVPSPMCLLAQQLPLIRGGVKREKLATELLSIAYDAGGEEGEGKDEEEEGGEGCCGDDARDDETYHQHPQAHENHEGALVAAEHPGSAEDRTASGREGQIDRHAETDDSEQDGLGDEEDPYEIEMCMQAEMFFPPLDGMAMFTLTCCMNHSCAPNVRLQWCNKPDGPIEISLVALRSIQEGEELCFSYIDGDIASVNERRAALKDYGFVCECPRCLSEAEAELAVGQLS